MSDMHFIYGIGDAMDDPLNVFIGNTFQADITAPQFVCTRALKFVRLWIINIPVVRLMSVSKVFSINSFSLLL